MASTPDTSGTAAVLSLTRMHSLRVDAANLTMTLEAGCVLQQAQRWAADAGLLLPLSLASEGSRTIGGNLATNAGGTQVLRFGNARPVLGLKWSRHRAGGMANRAAQRQHRLRLYANDGGQRGHAGHHHRGHACCTHVRSTPDGVGAVASVTGFVALLGMAPATLDAALTGFEMMATSAGHYGTAIATAHIPFNGRALTRYARGKRRTRRGARASRP